jgi:hypothetical protein
MTIFNFDKKFNITFTNIIDKKLMGRWQSISLIKVLKWLLQDTTDKKFIGKWQFLSLIKV